MSDSATDGVTARSTDGVTARSTDGLIPPGTPEEVRARAAFPGRVPVVDPTLGHPVADSAASGGAGPGGPDTPRHRLVVIGDSLSQGFRSGAISDTGWSYPAIIAYELGWLEHYRYPDYPEGGVPLNLELLLRDLQALDGDTISLGEAPGAALQLRRFMDRIEDYWERGPGARAPQHHFVHDLSVYGWTLHDALTRTAASCAEVCRASGPPRDDLVDQIPEHHAERAALRVYPNATEAERHETVFDTARRLGDEGGIETLIVMLGANNALSTVTELRVAWTDAAYRLDPDQTRYTVWDPQHFRDELRRVRDEVERIDARHVIWATVPHVTIAPIARAVGVAKAAPGSRYFDYYTRPWISDADFDPDRDPSLTGAQARAVDAAIDLYNEAITNLVLTARTSDVPRDWLLFDLAGLLDRLATKRYHRDPAAKPSWWTPYPTPAALGGLQPAPDTVFLTADGTGWPGHRRLVLPRRRPPDHDRLRPDRRRAGRDHARVRGAFADPADPADPAGRPGPEPVGVDFARLLEHDTLVRTPPQLIDETLALLGWADHTLRWVQRLFAPHRSGQRGPGPATES